MTPHRVIDLAAARAAFRIQRFVDDYERRHPPSERLPVDHPAVRACLGAVHPFLLDEFGGSGPAWDLLMLAAQYWFTPDDESLAYLCLRGQFQVAQGLCGNQPRLLAAIARYRAWRGLPALAVVPIRGGSDDALRASPSPD